jgi:hypothetical protein
MENLGRSTKEALSWILFAEINSIVEEQFSLAELHPSGGLYDCLSFISETKQVAAMANRDGNSLLWGEELLSDIWNRTMLDPHEAAMYVLSEVDVFVDPDGKPFRKPVTDCMMAIGNTLWFYRGRGVRMEWGWNDYQDSFGPNFEDGQYGLPDTWKTQDSAVPNADWRSWIWFLSFEGVFEYAFNLQNGEKTRLGRSTDLQLSKWRWPEDEPATPILAHRVTAFNGDKVIIETVVEPSMLRGVIRLLDIHRFEVEDLISLTDVPANFLEKLRAADTS